MHPSPFLVSGTLEDAVNALAERSVLVQHGAPRLTKEAMEKTAILGGLGDWWKGLTPTAQKGLMGAGLGAGLGLGSSYFKEKDERRPLSSALTGALAGGALGVGAGLASGNAPKITGEVDPAALSPGQVRHGGQVYDINPDVTPEIAARIAKLQGTAESGRGPVIPPYTTGAAGVLGAGGLVARLAGKLGPSTMSALESTNPAHLAKGLAGIEDIPKYLKGRGLPADGLATWLARLSSKDKRIAAMARGKVKDSAKLDIIRNLMQRGATSELSEAAIKAGHKTAKIRTSWLGHLIPSVFPKHITAAPGWRSMSNLRRFGRVGLPLAALGVGEHLWRGRRTRQSAADELGELIRQHAKPVQ